MGTFAATLDVGDPQGERYESIEAMVDTGSTYTWVPRDVLAGLGVEPAERREFETADGRVVERELAETRVRYDGQSRTTLVVFGEEGSKPLLGAYTLEGFGLAADPVRQRLVPVRGLALVGAQPRRDRASALSRAELRLGLYGERTNTKHRTSSIELRASNIKPRVGGTNHG